MLEKLKLVEARYLEMAERAAQPDFYNDPKAASQLLKEQRQLEPIITAYRSYMKTTQEQDDLRAMLSEGLDPEMKALCQEEFSANKKKLEELEQELKILLLPRDPNDDKSVIMEIRGGVGGEESALFAHSLYRMYTMYAESKRWTVTLLNYNETELGGVKEADFEIQGAGAYSRLKFESGVHRVQRVPETESGGRVHTSTATVAVLPEMEQAEVDIRPEDIEMQVYRSSGAGGQHINKTSSAVRMTHFPTGIVTPIARRYTLLDWAAQSENRYIIEDDYDSEFRLTGKPIPALQSIDSADRVIYMNTFSKSLASTIRISYMVLPTALAEAFYKNLGFYACTVSNLEQYTLAKFISEGYFEKHINRMRIRYKQKKDLILKEMKRCGLLKLAKIDAEDAGLHFLLRVCGPVPAEKITRRAAENGVRVTGLSAYYHTAPVNPQTAFVISYSEIPDACITEAVNRLAKAVTAAVMGER